MKKDERQIHFYAAREDSIKILADFEDGKKVKYSLVGLFREPVVKSYPSFEEIPDLGVAFSSNAISGSSYLVTYQDVDLWPARVSQAQGGDFFAIDQRNCPDSVVFMPGGIYEDGVLLYGKAGTV